MKVYSRDVPPERLYKVQLLIDLPDIMAQGFI
jgi:hypothetical protein